MIRNSDIDSRLAEHKLLLIRIDKKQDLEGYLIQARKPRRLMIRVTSLLKRVDYQVRVTLATLFPSLACRYKWVPC